MKKIILFLTFSILSALQLQSSAASNALVIERILAGASTGIFICKTPTLGEKKVRSHVIECKRPLNNAKDIESFCLLSYGIFKKKLRTIVLAPSFIIENNQIKESGVFIIIRNPEEFARAVLSPENCDVRFIDIYLSDCSEAEVTTFIEKLSQYFAPAPYPNPLRW